MSNWSQQAVCSVLVCTERISKYLTPPRMALPDKDTSSYVYSAFPIYHQLFA